MARCLQRELVRARLHAAEREAAERELTARIAELENENKSLRRQRVDNNVAHLQVTSKLKKKSPKIRRHLKKDKIIISNNMDFQKHNLMMMMQSMLISVTATIFCFLVIGLLTLFYMGYTQF